MQSHLSLASFAETLTYCNARQQGHAFKLCLSRERVDAEAISSMLLFILLCPSPCELFFDVHFSETLSSRAIWSHFYFQHSFSHSVFFSPYSSQPVGMHITFVFLPLLLTPSVSLLIIFLYFSIVGSFVKSVPWGGKDKKVVSIIFSSFKRIFWISTGYKVCRLYFVE